MLDARIRAVLRRMTPASSPVETYGGLIIDRASLIVQRAGRQVSLTPTELRLLLVLSGSPRQVFSRGQLLDAVWEQDWTWETRGWLTPACSGCERRSKPTRPSRRYIQTVRGFGYRFGPV